MMHFTILLTNETLIKTLFTSIQALRGWRDIASGQFAFDVWVAALYCYFFALDHRRSTRWGRVYALLRLQDEAIRRGLLPEVPFKDQLRVTAIFCLGFFTLWFFS